MPLPPALVKKLATRGILTENEGKMCTSNIIIMLYYKHYYLREGYKILNQKIIFKSRFSYMYKSFIIHVLT